MIFTSDNGGERYSYNWPFSFQKMYLYEGGTRVPAIVRWPGAIPAGRVTEQAAITMDWTATILAVTGSAAGSRLSARRREPDAGLHRASARSTIARCSGARSSARRRASATGSTCADKDGEYLFDLSVDPGEKDDRRRKQADTFEQIKQQYLAWNARMLPRPQRPST